MLSRTLLENSRALTRALSHHYRRAIPTADTLNSQNFSESCGCPYVHPRHCRSSNIRGFATESSRSENGSSEGAVFDAEQPSGQQLDSSAEDEIARAAESEAPQV